MSILSGALGAIMSFVGVGLLIASAFVTRDTPVSFGISVVLVWLACRWVRDFFRTVADEAMGPPHVVVFQEDLRPSALDDPDWI